MNKLIILTALGWLLVSCNGNGEYVEDLTWQTAVAAMAADATGQGGQGGQVAANPNANAALAQANAYEATALAIRGNATRQAAIPTEIAAATAQAIVSQREATADALAVRAETLHIDATATGYAIMAEGTRQAIGQLATVDARMVADETDRLFLMRQADIQAVQRQHLINTLIAPAVILIGSSVMILAYMAYRLQLPVSVPHGPHTTYTPARLTRLTTREIPTEAQPEALPAPVEPLLLPAGLKGSIMLPATRGAGKTMTVRQLVDGRVAADGPQAVTVIDPHYTDGKWGLANVVIGEGDDALTYLETMRSELQLRKQQLRGGVRKFQPLTVVMEEMPVLAGEFGKTLLDVWKRWIWEGRKFGLNVIIVTQSTRVDALGIKGQGDLVDSFDHIIWLGQTAVSDWPDIAQGMNRPAVIRSGHNAPRPLIVPYDPRKDSESDQFIPYFVGQSGLVSPAQDGRQPSALPFTAPEPQGVTTQFGYVTPAQVAQIIAMRKQGRPISQIETTVFSQRTSGGNAYYKVKKVLEIYGVTLVVE